MDTDTAQQTGMTGDMTRQDMTGPASGHERIVPQRDGESGEVPVHTKWLCTITMMVFGLLLDIVQPAMQTNQYSQGTVGFNWCIFSFLVGLVAIIIIPYRSKYPEQMFWVACLLVVIFPLDSLLAIMMFTSTLARRNQRAVAIRSTIMVTAVSLWSQLRDARQAPNASVWKIFFSEPRDDKEAPIIVTTNQTTINWAATIVTLSAIAVATLIGLYIRSRASLDVANLKTDETQNHAATLENALSSKQVSEAIAAEAHDTLAHSLTLISLNANVVVIQAEQLRRQMEAGDAQRNPDRPAVDYDNIRDTAESIHEKATDIQRQAKNALNDAHSIIGMLKNPRTALQALAPNDETSMTRESLEGLINDAKASGMKIATWIDIHQLSELNPTISKVAYRAVQEGLTNARRHAPGQEVSLELTAAPQLGVHIHISNETAGGHGLAEVSRGGRTSATNWPMQEQQPDTGGNGLPGLKERARAVGGKCEYGVDSRRHFTLEMSLPWLSNTAEPVKPS